jgi:hypothetical protein
MKFNNHKELSEYIFEVYMEFGKYSIQDKCCYNAFELGVKTLENHKAAAILLNEAMKNPHKNLDEYDYTFVGCSVKVAVEKLICELFETEGEEAFETWFAEIAELIDNDNLFRELTEI